jgi:hypothetical protein
MELEFYIEVPMSNTTGDDEKGISIKGGDSDSRIGSWGGGGGFSHGIPRARRWSGSK